VATTNSELEILPSLGINIDTLVFKTGFSNISYTATLTDDFDKNWRSETETGMITTSLVLFCVVGTSVMVNIFLAVHSKSKQYLRQDTQQVISEIFEFKTISARVKTNGLQPEIENPFFEEERYLTIITVTKFILTIMVMICITASYLNAVTAENPWSMES